MRTAILALLLGAATAFPLFAGAMAEIAISAPFAFATPERAPVGGAYLSITNPGSEPDRLLSVTTTAGREVQIHVSSQSEGVVSMRHLPDGLPIPAGSTVVLEPGGIHLMVLGLMRPLSAGGALDMRLHFERAGEVAVTFEILARGAVPHTQH